MTKGHKLLLVAAVTALVALVLGVGYAAAQSSTGGAADTTTADNQQPHPRGRLMAGVVEKVDGNTITLKTRKGDEKSFDVDGNTKYRKPPNGQASLSDVKAGEKIGVLLAKPASGQNPLAKVVIIGGPRGGKGAAMVGQVTAVNGNTVTIHTDNNGDKQVQIPSIAPGSRIGVITGQDGSVRGVLFNPPQRSQVGGDGQTAAPGAPQTGTGQTT